MEYGSMTGASSGALIRPFGAHIRHSGSFGLTVEVFRLEGEAYKRSVRLYMLFHSPPVHRSQLDYILLGLRPTPHCYSPGAKRDIILAGLQWDW